VTAATPARPYSSAPNDLFHQRECGTRKEGMFRESRVEICQSEAKEVRAGTRSAARQVLRLPPTANNRASTNSLSHCGCEGAGVP